LDAEEKYSFWVDIAEYDMVTAEAMLKAGRYLYVVFMCQQSIEKMLKGLYILKKQKEPPRLHNLVRLFHKIYGNTDNELNPKHGLEFKNYLQLFAKLTAYYISERYPSYREKLSESINKKEATEILLKTKEAFLWLKSLEKS